MIDPSRTITAPTGTSFLRAASRATSSALRMYCSSFVSDEAPNDGSRALSACKRRLVCLAERKLAPGIPIDDDVITFRETTLEDRQRQGILQQALDRAFERSSTESRVVTLGCEHFSGSRCQLERELSLSEQLLEPLELQVDDMLNLLLAERTEDDDVINAVEKLGTEVLTQSAQHLCFDHGTIVTGVLEDVGAADV